VDARLVGTAGLQLGLDQRRPTECLDRRTRFCWRPPLASAARREPGTGGRCRGRRESRRGHRRRSRGSGVSPSGAAAAVAGGAQPRGGAPASSAGGVPVEAVDDVQPMVAGSRFASSVRARLITVSRSPRASVTIRPAGLLMTMTSASRWRIGSAGRRGPRVSRGRPGWCRRSAASATHAPGSITTVPSTRTWPTSTSRLAREYDTPSSCWTARARR
jgi:hypothetical protein